MPRRWAVGVISASRREVANPVREAAVFAPAQRPCRDRLGLALLSYGMRLNGSVEGPPHPVPAAPEPTSPHRGEVRRAAARLGQPSVETIDHATSHPVVNLSPVGKGRPRERPGEGEDKSESINDIGYHTESQRFWVWVMFPSPSGFVGAFSLPGYGPICAHISEMRSRSGSWVISGPVSWGTASPERGVGGHRRSSKESSRRAQGHRWPRCRCGPRGPGRQPPSSCNRALASWRSGNSLGSAKIF
jgi:hypothetical protein